MVLQAHGIIFPRVEVKGSTCWILGPRMYQSKIIFYDMINACTRSKNNNLND